MNTKRFLLLSAVILLLLPLLGGIITVAQGTEVEIWASDDEFGDCWSNYFVDNFPNPDIKINLVLQPSGALDSALRTAVMGGGGPDLVSSYGPGFMLQLVEANVLEPLDRYAEEYNWADRFVPWSLDIGRVKGQLYSLSAELETMVVWYNKTLFEEHGWEVPTTMDELLALAQQVSDAEIVPFGPAFGDFTGGWNWYSGVFYSHYAGPDLTYAALTGDAKWTDPAFHEALGKYVDMVQKGWFEGSLDLYFTDTFDTSHALFGNGEIAMNIEGTWLQSYIDPYFGEAAGNNNEWDWFPIPTTFTTDPFYVIGIGSSYGINAQSDVKDAAAEVLDYFFSIETQLAFFNQCGMAPAALNFQGDVFGDTDPRIARLYRSFSEASAKGNYGYTNWTFWPAKTNDFMWEGMAKVFTGDMTLDDYFVQMQAIFDEELSEGLVPPIPPR